MRSFSRAIPPAWISASDNTAPPAGNARQPSASGVVCPVGAYKGSDWYSIKDKPTEEVDVAMDSMCPVCNGFTAMQATCPACNQMIQDAGRLSDLFGKYSPYRPIDALKQTNGIAHDLADRTCVHVGWCPACREEFLYHIGEWTGIDPAWHTIE